MFIYKVQLNDSHIYHGTETPFEVHVLPHNVTRSIVTCNRNENRTGLVFDCVPPVNGAVLQVKSEGNATLVICDAFISGIGETFVLKGTLSRILTDF